MEIQNKSIQDAIKKISETYSNISGDVLRQATSRALNRSASSGRTLSNSEIRRKYAISASVLQNIIKNTNSTSRNLEASIRASGAPLSWNYFGAKQQLAQGTTSFNRRGVASSRLNRKAQSNAKRGVTAKILKSGKEVNLPTAFIQVANGGLTVFARGRNKGNSEGFEFSKPRLPIGNITTLSVPMMFANQNILDATTKKVIEVLDDRITRELYYILNR
jgi:hypothetical protein